MSEKRIKVAGIRPRAGSIGPPGIHLRWSFPPSDGFPKKGFDVFRRPSPKKQGPSVESEEAEKEACLADWGPPIAELPLVTTEDEAKKRLEPGLGNRYAAGLPEALQLYVNELPSLIDWLQLLGNPQSNRFSNPGAQPHHLRLRHPDSDAPVQELAPQSMLLLGALDPNIARFLSLYWVDAHGSPDGPAPDQAYDYKVVGTWPRHQLCGVLFHVGAAEAALPTVSGPVKANQLPGIRWVGTDPVGRVGVGWGRAAGATPTTQPTTTTPVLFDVRRASPDSADLLLTRHRPVLVSKESWRDTRAARFVDTGVPLGTYHYRVRGIDIFGQAGAWLDPAAVEVKDLEAPPPAVRLRAATSPQASFRLRFEYGAFQYLQAPDASKFTVYWRPDSLMTDVTAEVEVVSEEIVDGGLRVYELELRTGELGGCLSLVFPWLFDGDVENLPRFASGYLTNVRTEGDRLPARDRRRYRIATIIDDRRIRLAPTSTVFDSGKYRVVNDPHAAETWQKLMSDVNVRPPVEGKIVRVEKPKPVPVTARRVRHIPERRDVLTMLPPSQRPGDTRDMQPHVEVLIDRTFLDSDLFAGCKVRIGNKTFESLYWVPGLGFDDDPSPEKGQTARISLPADALPTPGQVLELEPQIDTRWVALRADALLLDPQPDVGREPGGELSFFEPRDDGPSAMHVASVISGVEKLQDGIQLLVRLSDTAREALEANVGVEGRYFAPYYVEGPVHQTTSNAMGIVLPIPPGDGTRTAYLAVSTSDVRENEGALSVPAQITAVRQPPSGEPGKPWPCELGESAEEGYATPPDKMGRATVCVQWGQGTLATTEGIRFEVARALDNGIIATDRRNWMLARAGHEPGLPGLPLLPGAEMTGRIDPAPRPAGGGLFRVRVVDLTATGSSVHLDAHLARQLVRGRLMSGNLSFQITKTALSAGAALQLIVRPMIATSVPEPGTCRLAIAPDYTGIRPDSAALISLAAKPANGDAFGLATGVPIDDDRFTDEIPGIGRNRYFYRVRAVDAAENRSAWSPVSVPFHQVDTTPPDPPLIQRATGGNREATLRWPVSSDDTVVAYRVYRMADGVRATGMTPGTLVGELFSGVEHGQPLLGHRPVRYEFGRVNLNIAGIPSGPIDVQGAGLRVTGVFRSVPGGQPDTSTNYLVDSPTAVSPGKVTHVNPLLPNDTRAVVALLRASVQVFRGTPTTPLTVRSGRVRLSHRYGVIDVLGVYKEDEFDPGEPVESPSATSYFPSSAAFHLANQEVTGVAGLADDTAVAVVARCRTPYALGANLDEHFPLTVDNAEIDLAFPLDVVSVLGVYAHEDFDFQTDTPSNQTGPNHFDNGSSYVAGQHRITGLSSASLPSPWPVVVLARHRLPDGTQRTTTLTHRHLTGESLGARNGEVLLFAPPVPMGIIGVYKHEDYSFGQAPDDQTAWNYNLPAPTTVHPGSRSVVDLNPALGEGSAVTIQITDNAGQQVFVADHQDQWEHTDGPLDLSTGDGRRSYRLVAVRKVAENPEPNDSLWIPSLPSIPASVVLRDLTPPDPPTWTKVEWWDESNNAAAQPDVRTPVVRLGWATPVLDATCTLFRRDSGGDWRKLAYRMSGTIQGSGNTTFAFVDRNANPSRAYDYRVGITSRFEVSNETFNEHLLNALSSEVD